MKKRILSLLLAAVMCTALVVPAAAASDEALAAADRLNELGLFNGVGTNPDGTPNYDLDRAPTRHEAVTLLVRLLGKEAEAKAKGWYTYTPNPDLASWTFGTGDGTLARWKEQRGNWITPLTDVVDWAQPYVGYAYLNGLTSGVSATAFGGNDTVSATQYLTFVLRALGYTSGTDFQWDKAWELTDQLGITSGQYSAGTAFTRGDAAIVSNNALSATLKGTATTLYDSIFKPDAQAETVEITGKFSFMISNRAPALVRVSLGGLDADTIMIDGQPVELGEFSAFDVYGLQNWTEAQWAELYDPYAGLTSNTASHTKVHVTGVMRKDAEGLPVIEVLSVEAAK